jgi:SpoVK/Ycf46/Vps4 family AAA+-type ATPase
VLEAEGYKVNLTSGDHEQLNWLAQGMYSVQIEQAVRRSAVKQGELSQNVLADLVEAKGQIMRQSPLLEYTEPGVSFRDVVGAPVLAAWVRYLKVAALEEHWLPLPRGALFLGIPGCGKSLCARAIAGEWQMPLLRLDMGRIFASWLGQSEGNLRDALFTASRLSPVVLWLDEIDKMAAGLVGGQATAPTLRRVMGTLFTWLQERTAPVFTVATANDLRTLPIELFRRGRFDELFFFDLPTLVDRQALFSKVLEQGGHRLPVEDLEILSGASDQFSGVEIEGCVHDAIFRAAYADRPHPVREDVLQSIEDCRPLGRVRPDQVRAMRQWGQLLGARWVSFEGNLFV